MSRRIRKKHSMLKNQFKTITIALIIAVCLFVIYKYNFITRSEVEITTSVKFKEFDGSNEVLANIPLLEDEQGKYIILPEKVNGIFTSAYYLSENLTKHKVDKIENTVVDNTISNITVENDTNTSLVEQNTNTTNNTIQNEIVNEISNETINTNTIENQTVNEIEDNIVSEELENSEEEKVEDLEEEVIPVSAEEQILAMQESLFDLATKNSEEYADKLEQIAENMNSVDDKNELPEENTEIEAPTTVQENNQILDQVSDTEVNQEVPTESVNNEERVVPKTGNEIITEKEITLPGEKYYLSEEELENEDFTLTVKFQTVEINGEVLYNQEFISDMINAVIKLTCYTPLGYHLDVNEEDVNMVQELKADVEKISNSETLLAYDIKIINGEKEFQPEEYYQVATVSITKPEVVDFKSNSHSLQLLHIKENEEEINFERIQMSNIENDSFEFMANEFSTYAVILYAADQGKMITINDYESDKNYYLGKNYTDNMAGYNAEKYTEDNLAQVNINYYSYDPDINLSATEEIVLNNCNWNFNNNPKYEEGYIQVLVEEHYELIDGEETLIEEHWETQWGIASSNFTVNTKILNPNGSYIDIDDNWSMEFEVPTNLRQTFENSFNLNKTNIDNNSKKIVFSYDSNTYKLKLTGTDMKLWNVSSNAINHAVGPYELSFVLSFNEKVDINSFNPASQKFTGVKRKLVGTTSNTEEHELYSYVKCIPIEDGKVNVELIDNPFMDRPAGFGFNGWLSKESNTRISTDSSTFVQTLQRTLEANEIASKEVTINVYVDWKEASIVFVDASNGNNSNDGLTVSTPVKDWTGIRNELKKIATTTASNRELNIVVLINGSLANFTNNPSFAYTITSLYNGEDYRNRAQVTVNNTNFTANYDIQIDFIKTSSSQNYTSANGSDTATSTGNGYLSGGSYNLRIGRGMVVATNGRASIPHVFGSSNSNLKRNYKLVIESRLL